MYLSGKLDGQRRFVELVVIPYQKQGRELQSPPGKRTDYHHFERQISSFPGRSTHTDSVILSVHQGIASKSRHL